MQNATRISLAALALCGALAVPGGQLFAKERGAEERLRNRLEQKVERMERRMERREDRLERLENKIAHTDSLRELRALRRQLRAWYR